MMDKFKGYVRSAVDWVGANFRAYFWYFVVFIFGIIFGGFFI